MPVPQSVAEDTTQSTSWADRMEDLEAAKITPGQSLVQGIKTINK